MLTWYNFLKEESQYDGEIKTMHRTEKGKPLGDLEQFKTERITTKRYLTIPDEARINGIYKVKAIPTMHLN